MRGWLNLLVAQLVWEQSGCSEKPVAAIPFPSANPPGRKEHRQSRLQIH
jgi:hypothetical protein